VYCAALSEETARWAGGWADGLITVNAPPDTLRGIVNAFREGGGEGKPLSLQVHIALSEADAYEQWRTNVFPSAVLADTKRVDQFDALGDFARPEDLTPGVRISADPEQHVAWLREDLGVGFDRLYLHGVGRDQERFIDLFAREVLPHLRTP
jgi:alkanesulfonate monooxygenase SsuD/methylene tetrahydromethanopterin reductase-like flavin-dependent oxidoreductase (luciferase family)